MRGEIEAELGRIHRGADDDDASRRPMPPARGDEVILAATARGLPNDVQSIAVIGGPTEGGFTLRGSAPAPVGAWAVGLSYDATAAAVQAALEPKFGVGNVTCSGGPLGAAPVVVTFGGALSNTPVATMTADGSGLGLPPASRYEVRIIHLAAGEVDYPIARFASWTVRISPGTPNAPTGGSWLWNGSLLDGTPWAAAPAYDATAAAIQSILEGIFGAGTVTCSGGPLNLAPVVVAFGGALLGMQVPTTTTSGGALSGPGAPYLVPVVAVQAGTILSSSYRLRLAAVQGVESADVGDPPDYDAGGRYVHAQDRTAGYGPPLGAMVKARWYNGGYAFFW